MVQSLFQASKHILMRYKVGNNLWPNGALTWFHEGDDVPCTPRVSSEGSFQGRGSQGPLQAAETRDRVSVSVVASSSRRPFHLRSSFRAASFLALPEL